MSKNDTILRFDSVTFGYKETKPLLEAVDFGVRRGSKTTIMGQNGSGKSTLFKLIAREILPTEGTINVVAGVSIAVSRQVIPRNELELTVGEFFEKALNQDPHNKVYDVDPRIDSVLEVVNLQAPKDRKLNTFSGGQQARLLLASALIQDPDLLLLDEPTNNLDTAGIAHLTDFLKKYEKTVLVISHDSEFLNSFSDGVLYLDVFTRKIEQYVGNYFDVRRQILARLEKENRKNAQLAKEIQANKEKANFFAMKGGQMRMVAKRMREKAEEMEEAKIDVRKEDKTIRPFIIPSQENIGGVVELTSYKTYHDGKVVQHKTNIKLGRNRHLLLSGPNGIGKSTFLELIAKNEAYGMAMPIGIKIGYYRQDFSTLDFEDTVMKSLTDAAPELTEEKIRGIAAGFLLTGNVVYSKIGTLSEGQKGLVAFARLILQRPGLLILDEPTNHINFRHIPIIAEALNKYDGVMILVSHVPDFVEKIRIDEVLDLGK
ncbi:MAG: ABC-F family ATP-binding cassette domain-containing protein [Candidatus Paceibacterota bacterium]|jgi:ATP-binding cassette subfamily F protein 3|nr:ATP-binding cassette domain-containing protein [Candidatus Paceibacterota bacterium]